MMKKNIITVFIASVALVIGVGGLASCSKMLNTEPTSNVSTEKLYSTVEGANAAINGLYRKLMMPSSTEGVNREQSFGLASNHLAMEIMADDMVQREPGKGFYSYHYVLDNRSYPTNVGWTSYEIWNQWYTVINQTNEIIAYTPAAVGDQALKNNILGQAHALRSFAYFGLVRWYAKTYVGNEQSKGVPIYLEPTSPQTQGRARGTVADVYRQINADLDTALLLFAEASPAVHKSHIDSYVTWGFRSRVALVQENWALAAEAASNALGKPGVALMPNTQLFTGFNNLDNTEWMWGMKISNDQSAMYASLWAHLDARLPMHAEVSRKLVSRWLYNKIIASDVRAQWFVDPGSIDEDAEIGPAVAYNQMKFQAPSTNSTAGDYVYMRAAEMYLNRAEALCRLGDYPGARETLLTVIEPRYDAGYYAELLKSVPDGNIQTPIARNDETSIVNLLDEILLQRRIELWGEGFRWFDVIRTKSGYSRAYSGTNHPFALRMLDPNDPKFLMTLPQVEFDTNPMMDPATDQNPL